MPGILHARIDQTPIAIIDFETTGLSPGRDRVVEVSVVRKNPGGEPHLIFDSLVHPRRRVGATEIHGITDDDVEGAPYFEEIAGDLLNAISECVVTAYNVYFDLRFLEFELSAAGKPFTPPHFCLMYMRPMLGLGSRCRLEDACRTFAISHEPTHRAAHDAQASAQLLTNYLRVLEERQVSTFSHLARLGTYKFIHSFEKDTFPSTPAFPPCSKRRPRTDRLPSKSQDPTLQSFRTYWDALKIVLADLRIEDEEVAQIDELRKKLNLPIEFVRALHARAFASAISQFADDQWLDGDEIRKLQLLKRALRRLGWAPGDGVAQTEEGNVGTSDAGPDPAAPLKPREATPVRPQPGVAAIATSLAGKTIVVTGTMEKYGREEIEMLIEQHGGKASSSVSSKTDYVVAGPGAGSKLAKAEKLGVPVISEKEFDELLSPT